jgi:hypothetical protein
MYQVTSYSPLRKKYLPVLNRGAQRKMGVGRQIMVMTTGKLNGKTRYLGQFQEIMTKCI